MRSLRTLVGQVRRDIDLRAYLAELPLHPRRWGALRRGRAAQGRPPYLATVPNERKLSFSPSRPLLAWGEGPAPSRPSRIPLASRFLEIPAASPFPWDASFEDYEDAAALHRFAWLLPEVLSWSRSGTSRMEAWEQFRALALGWATKHPTPGLTAAWHAYTASERLCNWTLTALALGESLREDDELWSSIRIQGEHLRLNLEYHGERLTGNHLSNNGRALYLCGLACDESAWAAEGREILLHELERLFLDPRFLREGASHYQFLVARNFCEALWAARTAGDRATEAALSPAVARMAEGCRFFLVRTPLEKWTIPLIGDISPDCPPDWLTGVPWVASALSGAAPPPGIPPERGWHELFPALTRITSAETPRLPPSAAWGRVDLRDWTLMAHVNPDGFPYYPGHAHQDTGAFVAYYRGAEVVVDAARRRYLDDESGRWGASCWAHSLLSVDRLDPAPNWRNIYPADFIERRAGRKPGLEARGDGVTIIHGGFRRSSGVGEYKRSISILDDASLAVSDEIEGTGRHRVDLVFHFAGRASMMDGVVAVEGDGWRGRLTLPQEFADISIWNAPQDSESFGWRADRYGGKLPAAAIVAGAEIPLPWRGGSLFRMVN
jgi:hypothetical protein